MGLGLALRLAYWSGYGLADDPIFRGNVIELLQTHDLLGDNISYRLAWLIPTSLFCKIFGLPEFGMIFPITATSTLRCTSSKTSGPFGLVSKSHSRHVAFLMRRSDSLACAAPASRV